MMIEISFETLEEIIDIFRNTVDGNSGFTVAEYHEDLYNELLKKKNDSRRKTTD